MGTTSTVTGTQPILYLRDKECHAGYKVASAFPVLGNLFQGLATSDIKTKLKLINVQSTKTKDDETRAVKLLKSENHYNAIGIARDLLILAAVVASFVLGFFGLVPLVAVALTIVGQTIYQSYHVHKNKQMIIDINKNGLN